MWMLTEPPPYCLFLHVLYCSYWMHPYVWASRQRVELTKQTQICDSFPPPLPTFLPRLFSLFPTHITFQLWLSVPTAAVHLLLAQQSHCHVAFLFPWWRGAICRQRVSRLVAPHLPPWLSSMYVHFLISDSQIHWAHVLFHSCTHTCIRTHTP